LLRLLRFDYASYHASHADGCRQLAAASSYAPDAVPPPDAADARQLISLAADVAATPLRHTATDADTLALPLHYARC